MAERPPDMVDVVFDIGAITLPEDCHFALMREVARWLPWFESDPDAGIHPLRGASTDYGVILLPRRAKLTLRLSPHRVADALTLTGRELEIGATTLRVGPGKVRALRPHGAVYAHLVAAGCDAEEIFLERMAAQLRTLAASGKSVCGRRRTLRAAGREIIGFSLMLHELTSEDSLLLQRSGLGAERKLGCGIFVPHRLAAAVGSA